MKGRSKNHYYNYSNNPFNSCAASTHKNKFIHHTIDMPPISYLFIYSIVAFILNKNKPPLPLETKNHNLWRKQKERNASAIQYQMNHRQDLKIETLPPSKFSFRLIPSYRDRTICKNSREQEMKQPLIERVKACQKIKFEQKGMLWSNSRSRNQIRIRKKKALL